MAKSLLFILFTGYSLMLQAQLLPGFKPSGLFNEQQLVMESSPRGTRILINAPVSGFEDNDRVLLVFYALPNGNTIEQTLGKRLIEGDDWHYDIQHIGAQTRFLRSKLADRTVVVAYLENSLRSWPAWKAATPGYSEEASGIVSDVKRMFLKWQPEVVLNGHSGGGRFIFSYLDAFDEIPPDVVRIAFIDSNYGYEDTIYGPKLSKWLKSDSDRYLCTIAYNDSVVIYNGKPLVSPTGGTWYRSKMMMKYLSSEFRFRERKLDSISRYMASKGRIEFDLKPNPEGRIYHTRQVEYNGFIHSMLSGTKHEDKGYRYFGDRAYSALVADTIVMPVRRMNIPSRDASGETGSSFMKRISGVPPDEREEEIYRAAASGNMPDFLRHTMTLRGEFKDLEGKSHSVEYEAMPDYLAIGSDEDFCRIPMTPRTAQRLADLFGASLLTAKLSDHIWSSSEIRLAPFNYVPVGNANELVTKFEEHNARIEKQLAEAGGRHGQMVAGIKKDVIISSRIADRPDRVVIYGWHRPDGTPIQPVYSGHIWWYVDYSHGIRFVNNQVILDGKPALLTDILKDPVLFSLFSNEPSPMLQPFYTLP